ncbi:MAG: DUF262 domain-containing protein [Acidobacteriota bacterium]
MAQAPSLLEPIFNNCSPINGLTGSAIFQTENCWRIDFMDVLRYEYGDKTIQELVLLFKNGQLKLEPGFQRDSVWTDSDRKSLIKTILQNYPIPSVFLYKRNDNGKLVYDVIDGKQRIESMLMFQGLIRGNRFSVKLLENKEEWDWRRIKVRGLEHQFMSYKIQTVEIAGELSDIIDLFVRINSTGKKLTGAEKRHAKYYRSEFLKQAGKLAKQYESFFIQNKILSRGQISRMKHVELTSELLASINTRGPINKKKELDNIIGGQSIKGSVLQKCRNDFIRVINIIKKMFPEIRATRFANAVDFYSVFLLVWELDKNQCVLTDVKRNRQSQKLLVWLSNGVDEVRQQVRKTEGAKPEQRLFADYLLTVQGDTDSQATRKRRADILRGILGGLFDKKDSQRKFTIEQRRLIWHSDEKKKCSNCNEQLDWNNFTIDHLKAHSKGGRTILSNATVMCRSCNSSKGAK